MLAITGIAVIAVFLILKGATIPNEADNGFTRKILNEKMEPSAYFHFGDFVTKISGVTRNSIFVSGEHPGWVLRSNLSFNKIDTLLYGVKLSEKLRAPSITIDSPFLYMYAPEISYLIKGVVDSARVDTLKLNTDLITRTAQISPQRLIVRAIDSTQSKQIFKVIDCMSGDVIKEIDPMEKQQYGGFDTDGNLKYDKTSGRIVYVKMFQNEYYCLDTNLNLLYKGHTIDTTYSNSVNIDLVNADGVTKVMATKPRVIVNRHVDASDGLLYIMSGLRADNEKLKNFNTIIPVDVYEISDGKYVGSFYLPRFEGKKIRDFKVFNNTLLALYEDGYCTIFSELPKFR